MKNHSTYDPEDIESLMRHKEFDELYAEEKAFVLRHLENRDEYESIRRTLFEIQATRDDEKWLDPDPSIRRNLMAAFRDRPAVSLTVWLNALFAPAPSRWGHFGRPALALASVMLVCGFLFWWLYPRPALQVAQRIEKPAQQRPSVPAGKGDSAPVLRNGDGSALPSPGNARETEIAAVRTEPPVAEESIDVAVAEPAEDVSLESFKSITLSVQHDQGVFSEASKSPQNEGLSEATGYSSDDAERIHEGALNEWQPVTTAGNLFGKAPKAEKPASASGSVATSRPASADKGLLDLLYTAL
jgi:hypothetical protein